MQIGMIGLGRMGSNMVRRLLKAGHECIVYNRSPEPVRTLVGEGASGAASLAEFVRMLHSCALLAEPGAPSVYKSPWPKPSVCLTVENSMKWRAPFGT